MCPYYPTRYFRRQVVAWMIKHCQLVMANKGCGTYGQLWIRGGWSVQGGHFLPNSIYGTYSSATSGEMRSSSMLLVCMWNLRITVLNSRTLEEYQIWHSLLSGWCRCGHCLQLWESLLCCWWVLVTLLVMLLYLLVMLLYLYRKNWSCCWSPCMVDLLVTLLCISVCADEDLEKYVLETSKLCCTMFQTQVSSRHWRWSTGWNIQWGWGRGSGPRSGHH